MKLPNDIFYGATLFGWSVMAACLALTALLIPWGPQSRDPDGLSWEGYDSCRFPPKADGFAAAESISPALP